jgi:hypothetical protein
MAERKGVAVLLIRHMSKQEARNALYRGGGSIGIIGAARSGLVVEQHPDDEDLRVVAMLKSNLAEQTPSLTYTIVTAENSAAKVEWKGTTDHTADELLNGADTTSKLDEARAWLRERLANGPVLADKVEQDGKGAGISAKTLNRAKKGVARSEKDGPEGQWRWHLEDGQHCQDGQDIQGSQEDGGTESDCECDGRGCIHCLTQELPFGSLTGAEPRFCGHGSYEDCYVCNPNHLFYKALSELYPLSVDKRDAL